MVRAAGPSSVGGKSPVTTANAAADGGGGNGTTNIGGAGGRLEMDLSNDSKLQVEGEDDDDIGMVDISLDDNNKTLDNHVNNNAGGIMMELETEWSNNPSKDDETREDMELKVVPFTQQQQQRQRCSTSPLPIVRSGSGLSIPAVLTGVGVSQQQQQQQQAQDYQVHRLFNTNNNNNNNNALSSNNSLGSSSNSNTRSISRSINARSRSFNKNMRARSYSRGGGGGDSLNSSGRWANSSGTNNNRPTSRSGSAMSLSGRRMRSASAANAFQTDIPVVCCDDSLDHSCHKYQDEETVITEAMNVLLKDIISVRHETPTSSSKHKSVVITRVASFTPPTPQPPPPQPLYRPGSKLSTSSQPLSASAHSGMMNSYRIYIHTRMNGYLEFNFDNNSNSYEVMLAYLRCHLKDGMVPPDHKDLPVGNSTGIGAGASSSKGSSLEQPINLTRTKSLSNKGTTSKDNGGDNDAATVTSTSTASISSSRYNQQQQQHQSGDPPLISRSNSSNPIERLQTKAINRQLQQEETPINSMKHNVSGWLSSIVDCASFGCCQDTTVTPEYKANGIQSTPLRQSQSYRSQQSVTPRSKVLKSNGIGGLSFEVETVTSNMSGF